MVGTRSSSSKQLKRKTTVSDEEIIDSEEEEYSMSSEESQGESQSEDYSEDSEQELDDEEEELKREKEVSKKRRLEAQKYIESISKAGDEVDAAEVDRDLIAARLKQDVLESRHKVFTSVASSYEDISINQRISLKMDNYTPTSVIISPDNEHVFAGSKSGDIWQWRVSDGSRVRIFKKGGKAERKQSGNKQNSTNKPSGHVGHVLCLAISSCGRFLVSGGRDHFIMVWEIESGKRVECFTSHRGAVTGLVFQLGTNTFYSCSSDRTVRIWNATDLVHIDTLYGHQDEILNIDALATERCITVGSRDRTARLWKVAEESQLIFRASDEAGGSLDLVTMIDSDHFATASDTGAISLWGLGKKKPLLNELTAHSSSVSSLHSHRLTDLLLSASSKESVIKLWRVDTDTWRNLTLVNSVSAEEGVINGISLNGDGNLMAVAIGKDDRMGRWHVQKKAKNQILLIKFDK